MSLRIIAGNRRGAHLFTPEGLDTRPLRDRVRQALFDILRGTFDDARVLDAFAGSGAVGFESISRGATRAVFVEPSAPACDAIRKNTAKLRYEEFAELHQGKSPEVFAKLGDPKFTHLFLMPPYHSGFCWKCLAAPALEPLLAKERRVLAVCEIHIEEPDQLPKGWEVFDDRNYGITRILTLARGEQ